MLLFGACIIPIATGITVDCVPRYKSYVFTLVDMFSENIKLPTQAFRNWFITFLGISLLQCYPQWLWTSSMIKKKGYYGGKQMRFIVL